MAIYANTKMEIITTKFNWPAVRTYSGIWTRAVLLRRLMLKRFYKNLIFQGHITLILNKPIDECNVTTIIISLTECLNSMRRTYI
jgi:hypothetical protein